MISAGEIFIKVERSILLSVAGGGKSKLSINDWHPRGRPVFEFAPLSLLCR